MEKQRIISISNGDFVIKSPYNPNLVAKIKALPIRKWDGQSKTWRVPTSNNNAIIALAELATSEQFEIEKDAAIILDNADNLEPEPDKILSVVDNRFSFSFPYNPAIANTIKKLSGRKYEKKPAPHWTVPIDANAQSVLDIANKFDFYIKPKVNEIVQQAIKTAELNLVASRASNADFKADGLRGELMPFQRAGVAYATKAKRTFIADEMGLGKTIQALATIQANEAYPALIVCPASLKLNWQREAEKWLPEDTSIVVLSGKPNSDFIDCLDCLFSLDQQIRANGLKEGEYIKLPIDMPAILRLSAKRVSNSRSFVSQSSEITKPINENFVGTVNNNMPSTFSFRAKNTTFTINNTCQVTEMVGISGQNNDASLSSSGSDNDIASFQQIAESTGADTVFITDGFISPSSTEQRYCFLKTIFGPLSQLCHNKILLIINYDIVNVWSTILKTYINYKSIVLDESHYIKNSKSMRSKHAKEIGKQAEYRLCLTGTPIVNRPNELLSQLDFLGRLDDMGGFWDFAKRYCNAHRGHFGWDFGGATNLDELNDKLRQTCYIRRNKKDVLPELPTKQRSIIPIAIDNRKEYNAVHKDIENWIKERTKEDREFVKSIATLETDEKAKAIKERGTNAEERARNAEKLVLINKLKQAAVKGKLSSVLEWINNFLETGEKLVLFAHHQFVVDELAKEFDAPAITGQTSIEKRQEAVDTFQNNPNTKLLVLNIKAGGVGLTLTAASNVAFVELDWTPAAHDQAEDRCHRIGQRNSINAWYFLGENTIDNDIYLLIDDKRVVVDAATEGATDANDTSIFNELWKQLEQR